MGAMCQRASTGEMGAASSCSSANATGAPAGEKLAGSRKGPRHMHVAGLGRRAWPEQMLRAQQTQKAKSAVKCKRLVSGHLARRLRRRNLANPAPLRQESPESVTWFRGKDILIISNLQILIFKVLAPSAQTSTSKKEQAAGQAAWEGMCLISIPALSLSKRAVLTWTTMPASIRHLIGFPVMCSGCSKAARRAHSSSKCRNSFCKWCLIPRWNGALSTIFYLMAALDFSARYQAVAV